MTAAIAALTNGNIPEILEWGLRAIRAMQGTQPEWLTRAARAVTSLGDPLAYIPIIAFVYWCVDERRAYRAALTLFISNGLNIAIKGAFRLPRPFILDPSINLVPETGYAFPSGHSQNSAAFWPTLFLGTRSTVSALGSSTGAGTPSKRQTPANRNPARLVAFIAAFALPLLIGLSRSYLGVHYPTDVLGGWAIGAILAVIATLAFPAMARAFRQSELTAIRAIRESWASWRERSGHSSATWPIALAATGAFILNAINGEDSSMGGALFGFAAGPAFLAATIRESGKAREPGETEAVNGKRVFNGSEGTPIKKGARFIAGLLVLALLYFGLKAVLPGEGSSWYRLARFARYALCGFWTSGLAPLAFIKLGLSRSGR